MRYLKTLFAGLLLFLSLSQAADAAEVRRTILAVIDGAEIKDETFNLIAAYAEMPLNHLGYKVEYVDVSKRLPDHREMTKYAGIMSWFLDNKLKGSADYVKWLTEQVNRGTKLVVFDDWGFALDENEEPTPDDIIQGFYRAFNVSYDPDESTDSPLLIEIVKNDPKMTEFERGLAGELADFERLEVLDRTAEVYLELKRKDTGSTCDAVFVHSKGGYVLGNYAIFKNPENYESRWRIDPFKFFAKAFGSDFPKPDITTINGVRAYMSHVDGDGIRNISNVDGKTQAIKLLYDRFLTKYALPVSISVLVGDLIVAGEKERLFLTEMIRKIFALPNIEAASHGWAHPMYWDANRRKMAYDIPKYEYSPANEIGWSLKYINEYLVPPDKITNLFFWTGDCNPDHAALKYVYDNGIANINGGDTRFDSAYPSYTYVSPLFRHLDGLLQNLAVSANEVAYTNIWTGPFYGFKYAIETYKNTESPIRIRPVDVYYHFYLMDHGVAVDSLKQIMGWVGTQELAPIFISDHLKRVKGFLDTRIERVAPGRFVITGNGELKTMRIDGYDGFVDLARSKNVIGFLNYQGSLYVHLSSGDRSEIVLSKAPPARPYLVKANGPVEGLSVVQGNVSFKLRTMGKVLFSVGGLKRGQGYKVVISDKEHKLTADGKGMITFSGDIIKNSFEQVNIVVKEG